MEAQSRRFVEQSRSASGRDRNDGRDLARREGNQGPGGEVWEWVDSIRDPGAKRQTNATRKAHVSSCGAARPVNSARGGSTNRRGFSESRKTNKRLHFQKITISSTRSQTRQGLRQAAFAVIERGRKGKVRVTH